MPLPNTALQGVATFTATGTVLNAGTISLVVEGGNGGDAPGGGPGGLDGPRDLGGSAAAVNVSAAWTNRTGATIVWLPPSSPSGLPGSLANQEERSEAPEGWECRAGMPKKRSSPLRVARACWLPGRAPAVSVGQAAHSLPVTASQGQLPLASGTFPRLQGLRTPSPRRRHSWRWEVPRTSWPGRLWVTLAGEPGLLPGPTSGQSPRPVGAVVVVPSITSRSAAGRTGRCGRVAAR